MALNVTFTCTSIKDENGSKIDCYFQAYHPRTNKWNTIKQSAYSQYSFNAGDGDFLTQTGELKTGDHVLIAFWVGQQTRSGLQNRFAIIDVVHNGQSTYVIDVQLRPKLSPVC